MAKQTLLSVPTDLVEHILTNYHGVSVIQPASTPADVVYIPYPDEPGLLKTTKRKWESLLRDLGFPTVEYLCSQLERYAEDQPKKFAKYKDHAAVIRRWHEIKVGDGYVFSPKHNQYLKRWVAREDGVL